MRLPTPPAGTPSLDELADMFRSLQPETAPAWGKMDAAQMLAHCANFNELCLGKVKVGAPLRWIARLLGPLFLKSLMKKAATDGPRNLKTLDQIRVTGDVAFATAQERLQESIQSIASVQDGHRHPLYGPMRAVDVHALARHHMGHHAHQFRLW